MQVFVQYESIWMFVLSFIACKLYGATAMSDLVLSQTKPAAAIAAAIALAAAIAIAIAACPGSLCSTGSS